MIAAQNDLPPLGLLRRYLSATGWKKSKLRIPELTLFTLQEPESQALEVVLPERQSVADAEMRIKFAINSLSELEDRPREEICASILSVGQDTIRESIEAPLYRSVALGVAERIIAGSRRLLYATALAEFERGEPGNLQPAATRFVDKCRFGHTFVGSFGFTIHSPVGSPPTKLIEESEEAPPPPERMVIQRVIHSLTAFDNRLPKQDTQLLADPLFGFKPDMLDGLADLLEGSRAHEVTFRFELSPGWPIDESLALRTVVPIATGIAPDLRDLAADLRNRDVPNVSRITGLVTKLATKENPADLENLTGTREVTIGWEWGGRTVAVRVPLSPTDYRTAYEAHGAYEHLTAVGKLERAGKSYILRQARLVF